MKIDPNLPAVGPLSEAATARDARETRPGAAPAPQAGDRVSVSSAGASLGAMAAQPDFDERKVEAIRLAIREGRFSVDAEAIAGRLIDEATALLGPRTH